MREIRTVRTVHIAGYSIVVGLVAACASSGGTSVPLNDFGTLNGSKVEVVAEGGIAALSISDRMEHDSRAFAHVTRHLCATTCQAPSDSASGAVAANVADSVFSIVLEKARALDGDYGTTKSAADMMTYTVRVTSGGTTKTLRADDGTMPLAMKQLVAAVRESISAARK